MNAQPENALGFDGLRVVAFESRRAEDMARIIEKAGGIPYVSPSMREVPLEDNASAIDFAHRLITGQINIVIFMTGVGFEHLLAAVERQVGRQRYLNSLADITTIARGPKPVAAMKKVGLDPTLKVPEPNTWREVLTTVDQHLAVAHQRIGLQEYGEPNPSLVAGLEARGATVVTVKVYQWALPINATLLEQNIQRLAQRECDVVLITSAHQVANLLELADRMGLRDQVLEGLRRAVIASIGPTTSEALQQLGLAVDLEPSHPKMGHLVMETAQRSRALVEQKRVVIAYATQPTQPALDKNAPWYDSPFMRACRCESTHVTPVWLMRQAGRYMPEYRAIREKTSFDQLCRDPQLCAEVMITAVGRLHVDAAIIFSDLLPILEPMGLELEYGTEEGPIIHNPVREAADIDRIAQLESADALHFVIEAVRQTRHELPDKIPLIGFAGAPFTLASYVIEGGASRHFLHTKTLMYRDEGAWRELMQRFVRSVTIYLNAQIAAGVQCVQLFDSWVGCLGPDDYRRYVLPYVRQLIGGLPGDVPVISFATGNPVLLPLLAEAGPAVVGCDWRIALDEAWRKIGHNRAIQGNLDPAALLADLAHIRLRAKQILQQAGGRPGHIFNLGHGVLPQTPVDHAAALVEMVHELSVRK